MTGSSARLFAVVTAAALAARVAHFLLIWSHPWYELHRVWPDSDMHQLAVWAEHLASGDWLDTDTFRAWFPWQEAIAPPEVWESWFGAHVYYQPPLYPYLAAVILKVTGGLDALRMLQVALGAINAGLIGLLGDRLHGRTAGLIAGLGAAVYAPFIFYDAEILRGTLVLSLQIAMLLLLAVRKPALAGAAFGVAWLADPSVLLFAPLAVAWMWWGAPAAVKARAPALFLLAALAAVSPLVARNLAVGAPPLSSTTRAPLGFVMGNAPDARPAGAVIPESTGRILRASGYTMGGTISATLGMYRGDHGRLAGKQLEKLRALWGAYEVPDNPSFYQAARVSPVARFGLRFLPVAAFGLVGLALVLPGVSRDPRAALMPLFLLSCNALFLLAHVVSRYRQPMVIPLLVLGGHACAAAVAWWRQGRRGASLAVIASALGLMLILPWSPPSGYGYDRPAEHLMIARVLAGRGEIDAAAGVIGSYIASARGDPSRAHTAAPMLHELGLMQARAGRHRDAIASFREALRNDPALLESAEALAASERALAEPPDPRIPR